MIAISSTTLLVSYLMFTDADEIIIRLKPYAINGDLTRQLILLFCLLIYISRLFITNFIFLKRRMAWSEMLLVSGLMSFALFSFAKVGGSSHLTLNVFDYIGLALYLVGSWINTYSEQTRHTWKKRTINKGKLYTGGLFKYSMHINYFGDIVLFSGLTLITQSFSLQIIPLIMALNFVFF